MDLKVVHCYQRMVMKVMKTMVRCLQEVREGLEVPVELVEQHWQMDRKVEQHW
jgi:hypothetical protein